MKSHVHRYRTCAQKLPSLNRDERKWTSRVFLVPGVEGLVGAGAAVAAGTSDEAKSPELEVSMGAVPECTVPSVQALMVVVM